MKIELYQAIIVTIAVTFLLKALSHFLRGERTIKELIAVFVFWGFIEYIAIFPDTLGKISYFLGFKDYLAAILFSSIAIIFALLFKILLDQERHKQEITKLVRELALKDGENKDDIRT